jgi:hypothetical protein
MWDGHEPMATNEIQRLLLQNAAFTPPLRIVSAIPEKIRTLRVPSVPHSIAVFWQDRFLQWARREDLAYPQHAELGWQQIDSLSDSQWRELVAAFERGLTEAADIAGQPQLAERYSTPKEPSSDTGSLTLGGGEKLFQCPDTVVIGSFQVQNNGQHSVFVKPFDATR